MPRKSTTSSENDSYFFCSVPNIANKLYIFLNTLERNKNNRSWYHKAIIRLPVKTSFVLLQLDKNCKFHFEYDKNYVQLFRRELKNID